MKTGLKERTIRFYEEQGLLSPAKERRNGRNYREYTEADVERLKTIATLRRARFTLEEIQAMLEEDGAVETVFPAYLQRIEQEADSVQRLRDVAQRIRPTGLSPKRLAEELETGAKYLELPQADLSPHFGRFDPETPEEKQQAIEAYRKRQARKRLPAHYWAVAGLSMLCVLLAVGCAGIFLATREPAVEPPPSGTTQGYIYYKTYENGTYYICRYQEETGETEQIYESQEYLLAFLVERDKIYVSDGGKIYSMNADGQGRYLICKNAGATLYGRMAIYGGMLYVDTGLYGHGSSLARVSLTGGELEDLHIGTLTDFEIKDGVLYTDFAGDILLLELDTMTLREFDMETEPDGCVMDEGVIYELDGWNVEEYHGNAEAGSGVVTAYSLNEAGEMEMCFQFDLPEFATGGIKYVHNDVFYFYGVERNSKTRTLYARNLETGETVELTQTERDYPDVYWGENGLIVADFPDHPQYLPYPTFAD